VGLQKIIHKLNGGAHRYGMRIHAENTKIMKISKGERKVINILLDDYILEQA